MSRFGRLLPRYDTSDVNNYMRNIYHRLTNDAHKPVPREDNTVPDSGDSGETPLKVELVELYAVQNAEEHQTDRYELVQTKPSTPVLRRGNAFYIALQFAGRRSFDPKVDHVKLIFDFGPKPQITKGTRASLVVKDNTEFTLGKADWDIRIHGQNEAALTLHIQIPATVCVGLWRCKIVTSLRRDKTKKSSFKVKESIYILFNPWCKEDCVFMKEDDKRQEYVLSEVGKVYVGPAKRPIGRRWVFGQFDDIVLPACLYILEKSKLDYTARGSPVKVVRAISALVNSNDDNGILVGRWDGDYKDGKAPSDWTGSLQILDQYMKSGGEPVKYGQCWVFSGLTTTICRALGIPCRSVTNFVSAHDTDANLTIDKFFDAKGNNVDHLSSDSIWNFHVWNDAWMARPDLPMGYGGWQAIDATPQEQSEEIFQAGPASLEAIRRGEIGFLYDTPFIYSEVNADVIHWQEDEENEGLKKLRTNHYHVGRCIFTKKCVAFDDDGEEDADDITNDYKNPEGTESERLAVLNAARAGGVSHVYDMINPEDEDVVFDLIDIDKIMIGDPFDITVKILNKSQEPRSIYAVLSTASVYYTGVQAHRVKKADANFTLEPGQEEHLRINVQPDDYLDKLVDYSMMKIYAIATVKETRQTWTEEDDFAVDKPKINLEVLGPLQVGKKFPLKCSFTNPLDRALHDCHFTFEGPGLSKPLTVYVKDIQPKASIEHVQNFKPAKKGERKIVVNFGSTFLNDMGASKTVIIV